MKVRSQLISRPSWLIAAWQVTTLFFDCDNTLVLSEELAFTATATLINTILAKRGIAHRYTAEQLLVDFMGQSFRRMMPALQEKFNFSLTQAEMDDYVKEEEVRVVEKLEDKVQPCEGCMPVLEKLYNDNRYSMMVLSSSALHRIQASLRTTGQEKYFGDRVFSAATSLPKPATKPDPAVYLFVMKKFNLKPEECIAVEDSKSGATAAVRAGVATIAYVGSYHGEKKKDQVAETLLSLGCKVVMRHWSQLEKCIEEIENMQR